MAVASDQESSFNARAVVRRILWILPVSVVISVAIALVTTDPSDFLRLERFAGGYLLLAAGLFSRSAGKAKNLSTAFLVHPYGYHSGSADHMAVFTGLEVGGIKPHVGPLTAQLALEECVDPLVDLPTDP